MAGLKELYQLLTAFLEHFDEYTLDAQIGVLKTVQNEMRKIMERQEDDCK